MNFSVCTDSVFRGIPTPGAMEIVRSTGCDTIEFWTWWDKDITEIVEASTNLGMEVSAFCTHFYSMVDKSTQMHFIEGLKKSAETACKLSCRRLIAQVGNVLPGTDPKDQTEILLETLAKSIPVLKEYNIILLFEPLNTLVDHKGYFLSGSLEAFEIAKTINDSHVKVLFDIYHQVVMGEDPCKVIPDNIGYIGHFHSAGVPGRNEITRSPYDYSSVLELIANLGYTGFVGLEYMPREDIETELRTLFSRYGDL